MNGHKGYLSYIKVVFAEDVYQLKPTAGPYRSSMSLRLTASPLCIWGVGGCNMSHVSVLPYPG